MAADALTDDLVDSFTGSATAPVVATSTTVVGDDFNVFSGSAVAGGTLVGDNFNVPLVMATPPSPPINLVAIAQDGGAVVTWSAPNSVYGAAIDSYRVLATSGTSTISFGITTQTTMTLTNLVNSVTYIVSVYAESGSIESSPAATVTVTPTAGTGNTGGGTQPTPAPPILNVVGIDGALGVTWREATLVDYYQILVTDSSGTVLLSDIIDKSLTSDTVQGLNNGSTYTVELIAWYQNFSASSGVSAPTTPMANTEIGRTPVSPNVSLGTDDILGTETPIHAITAANIAPRQNIVIPSYATNVGYGVSTSAGHLMLMYIQDPTTQEREVWLPMGDSGHAVVDFMIGSPDPRTVSTSNPGRNGARNVTQFTDESAVSVSLYALDGGRDDDGLVQPASYWIQSLIGWMHPSRRVQLWYQIKGQLPRFMNLVADANNGAAYLSPASGGMNSLVTLNWKCPEGVQFEVNPNGNDMSTTDGRCQVNVSVSQ